MALNNVVIFHSPLTSNSPADELDVLDQVKFFNAGLANMGYIPVVSPFPYDLLKLAEIINEYKPSFVVNLVETLFGDGRLVHVAPSLFDYLRIPYTGCPSEAIFTTSNKVLAKKLMEGAGIKSPGMIRYDDLLPDKFHGTSKHYLVKSQWEHASYGMSEDEQLLFSTQEELLQKFESLNDRHNYYCEEYIDGREFNLSLIASDNGCDVLPPAEIKFFYPPSKPKILGYKSKWDEDSFEYKNTVRTFVFDKNDRHLLREMEEIAIRCWYLFELNGYARADFRVDSSGQIYVLEINANPCISPDSGFVAAASQAGLTQTDLLLRIINDIS